jgi:integrase/recombinase XerC
MYEDSSPNFQPELARVMLDQLLTQFLDHLRYERNVSAHTLRNYESDLQQFFAYLAPIENEAAAQPAAKHSSRAEGKAPDIKQIDHLTIREWLSNLHSDKKKKTSIARKLAALRTFFQFPGTRRRYRIESGKAGRDSAQRKEAPSPPFHRRRGPLH